MDVLIDLGELTREATAPPVSAPAPSPGRRPGVLTLVAVLTLLVTASAAVPPDPVRRLYSVPALGDAPILFTADRLYTIDTSGGHRAVAAYDLRDGRRRWSTATTLPLGLGWGLTDLPGAVLLNNFGGEPDTSMVAFDAATGAIRWRRSGGVLAPVPHLDAMVALDPDAATIRLVDLATGVARWQGSLGTGCDWAFDDDRDPRRLVRMCPDGTLSTVDMTDGRTLATRDIVRRVGAAGRYVGHDLVLGSGLAVVTVLDGPSLTWRMSAYALDDLAPRWVDRPLPLDAVLVPCASGDVCVYSGAGAVTISATTGEALPAVPPARAPVEMDAVGHGPADPPAVVLTPRDVPFDNRGHDAVVALSRPGDHVDAPRYAVSQDVWVLEALADPAAVTGWRYRPLGRISGAYAPRCVAVDGGPGERRLACATGPDVLTVWSLPDAPT